MKLNDSNLFRQQALINGEWLDANNGEVIDVTNPANGDKLGSVPKMGADETRAAIDAANRALSAVAEARGALRIGMTPARLACAHRQRTRQHSAQLVQFDDGASGRFSAPDDPRTGQTTGRSER